MKLNSLTCTLEALDRKISGGLALKEHQITYTDGEAQCFIAVPPNSDYFCIRITSDRFIAPSVCAYVFINGEYQCNRVQAGRGTRLGIYRPIEILLNGKECLKRDGLKMRPQKGHEEFWKKGWRFSDLNTGNIFCHSSFPSAFAFFHLR
jgi:hypothetical protein